jgi:serine phosphatase RsbU (regulator of sigma subunit)
MENDEVRVIDSANLPLGLFCTTEFEKTRVRLDPGGIILAYSDGVTESINPAGEEYGVSQLKEDLRQVLNSPPVEIVRSISAKIGRFTGGLPLTDDRTILVLGR